MELNCRYVDEFKVAWRKVNRQIWRLPSNTQNVIIQNLTYNIDDQLDARVAKFIHMCLNHDNDVREYKSIRVYFGKQNHLGN